MAIAPTPAMKSRKLSGPSSSVVRVRSQSSELSASARKPSRLGAA
jgi:hypothetical protein